MRLVRNGSLALCGVMLSACQLVTNVPSSISGAPTTGPNPTAGPTALGPTLPTVTTSAGVTSTTLASATSTPSTVSTAAFATSTTVPFVSAWPVPVGQLHRKLREAKTGPNPKQVAFTPNGRELWTPLLGSTGVDVFSVPDLRKIARIPLGKYGGVEVIFTRDGKRAYVSQMQTASVYEIDTNTKRILRILKTGGNWTKILELSPDEKTLYAANWVSDDISVLDLPTGTLRRKIPTVKTPRGLLVSDDGNTLYVAGFENGEIVQINLSAGSKTPSTVLYKTGGAMRHLALDRKSGLLYADDMGRDAVFVVDTATGVVRTMAKTDSHPNTIDLSPDLRYLYVSNRGQNSPKGYNQYGPDYGSVLVFDVTTGKAIDAIVGGNQTTGLDVSPDGTLLAFTDFQDARVQLYAIPSPDVLAKSDGARVKSYKPELLRKKR
jgi:YVTN family beta-propeller protein